MSHEKNLRWNTNLPELLLNDESEEDILMEFQSRFPNVSFVRGSERKSTKEKIQESSTFRLDNISMPRKRLSFENTLISDEDFFDADVGKEMIIHDQKIMEEELSLEHKYDNCKGCSSWVPVTSKKLSDLPLLMDADIVSGQVNISIGGYIQRRSEKLGCLSEDSVYDKEFFGCNTSTPSKRTLLDFDASSISRIESEMCTIDKKIKDMADFSTWSVQHHEYEDTSKKFPMFPKCLYSVTPKKKELENPGPLQYFIGTTCYRNIQRLRAEEKKQAKNWLSESFVLQTDKILENLNGNSKSSYSPSNKTLFPNGDEPRIQSYYGKESMMEQWMVHPEQLILDVSKGSRVQVTNNSKRDIKFKIEYDVHVISVSPVFGTIRAKNQIGLRILVLHSLKKQIHNIETFLKIIIGKNEKTVCVKIFKEEKSKLLMRKRSFILH